MGRETLLRGYGGPAFDYRQYVDEYKRGDYHQYKDLYDDVQMELDMLAGEIRNKWGVSSKQLIWFSDYLDPAQYTSGLTVEGTWEEDFSQGVDYFEDLVEWLTQREGPFEPQDLQGYDRSKMKSIYDLLGDFDWDKLGWDDWDQWGPYAWHPFDGGEWSRCRIIAHDHQDYPVSVLVDGSMIDGAHRLAVAIFNGRRSYPCQVGVPETLFQKSRFSANARRKPNKIEWLNKLFS
jgi:hypothetical protein